MAKFDSADEDGLQKIFWKILRLTRVAPEMVAENWANSELDM